MSGGKGNSITQNTIRYAPYLEGHHQVLLDGYRDHAEWLLWEPSEQADRPYMDYDEITIETAFFGSGYALSSFPSLYDMYGKFMAGLDVEVLFDQHFGDTISGTVVSNVISEEALALEDDIVENAAPRFKAGLRDINSVISSSFLTGLAMMEVARTRAISKFSADIRYRLLPLVTERWKTHLDWNKTVIDSYAQILKFYLTAKMDIDNHNVEFHVKDKLWPFSIMEQYRVAVGTLHGAQSITETVKGASRAQKAIGGALTGASTGAMIGSAVPGIGTAIGAVVGGILGVGGGLL